MLQISSDDLIWFFSLVLIFIGSPSSMPHLPYEKSKMIDITRDKPIKIAVRVAVPVRDHPKVSDIWTNIYIESTFIRADDVCKKIIKIFHYY